MIPEGNTFSGAHLPGLAPFSALPTDPWRDALLYFGWFRLPLTGVPDWHLNPFSGGRVAGTRLPWWEIPDFDDATGDIKAIWEPSRFDWALALAERARAGERGAISTLNAWTSDWTAKNAPYVGPNWKCGQEASIRVLHLALVARMLGEHRESSAPLLSLIECHLKRIYPTLSYAIGQSNNHGTSEAAALFVGGLWLNAHGYPSAAKWASAGRKWLENRARALISEDGSFSQYSVNYHRLMLDTYSIAEVWRREWRSDPFSQTLSERLAAAARWLHTVTQAETGRAPNCGANDGANLLPLAGASVLDYRPSVQLSTALWSNMVAYEAAGSWNDLAVRLEVDLPTAGVQPPSSVQLDDGGYSVLRKGKAFALLRYPKFKFRPSHADALHLDLWIGGVPHLADAGTYSYNAADGSTAYFRGTASHNTVQFDGRDQMPVLGRFLFGDWLTADQVEEVRDAEGEVTAAAGYTDGHGAVHRRRVVLTEALLTVEDEVSGNWSRAALRWRLPHAEWQRSENGFSSAVGNLTITSRGAATTIDLTAGWESKHYLDRTSVPVAECIIHSPCVLRTQYRWHS